MYNPTFQLQSFIEYIPDWPLHVRGQCSSIPALYSMQGFYLYVQSYMLRHWAVNFRDASSQHLPQQLQISKSSEELCYHLLTFSSHCCKSVGLLAHNLSSAGTLLGSLNMTASLSGSWHIGLRWLKLCL